jgi:spermidine synthase
MNGTEQIIFSDDAIEFTGYPKDAYIMHRSEARVMQELSHLACQRGGDILEIGFGMGMSAQYIQSHDIQSHTIIEVHPEIYTHALRWADGNPTIKVLLGDWYDILPTMTTTFDGILHDTHEDIHLREFFNTVQHVCKNGTVVAAFRYPFTDVPLHRVDIPLTEYEQTLSPIPNIKKFTLAWNQYINGEFTT